MKKLLFVCGPSGIGKSHFSKKYIAEHPNEHVEVISSKDDRNSPKDNLALCKQAKMLFKDNDSITIILDTTLLTNEKRLFFLEHLPKVDKAICYLIKLRDYSIIYQRNKNRPQEEWVADEVIASMIRSYVDPNPEVAKHFDQIFTIYND